MALYESEYTKFLREMREKHPEWAKEQEEGLALLWDKTVDVEEQKRIRESAEPARAYPYDVHFFR
ncbi:DUF3460 family protein [Propionivibrio limicola]|uniref:DUF3460 family protein n=1 Tax=Propionivibrio limicola TaxID=167645 RepID=UPI0012923D01|nr:DUF3460 family protein [Propionivibrio limicola]